MSAALLFATAISSFSLRTDVPHSMASSTKRAPSIVALAARKSRYADDGTRQQGTTGLQDGADKLLAGGLFSRFSFGKEVEVGPATKPKKGAPRGMARDNSDRGLRGNTAYRNTESARLRGSVDQGQRLRNQRLEEYINSEEAPADKTFGKIISGSLILVLIALLGGVVSYYGIDGLVAAPRRM